MYLPRSNIHRILALTLPGGISFGILLYALISMVVPQGGASPSVAFVLAFLFGGVIGLALSLAVWISLRYALAEARRYAALVLQADLPPVTDQDPLVALRQTVADAIAAVPQPPVLAILAQRLIAATDRDAMVAAVAECLANHVAARGAVLLLHDPERGILIPSAGWGLASVNRAVTFDIDGSAVGRAVRERRAVSFSSVQMRSLLAATSSQALTVTSWPLWVQQTPLGALCLIIAGADVRLNEAQQQLIEQAAALFTVHLQTSVYRQWFDREQRRLSAFEQVMTSVIEQPDLERALVQLLRIAADVTDSSHGTLLLIDAESFTIRTRITLSGGDVLPLNLAAAPILKHGLAGWVLRMRRGAIIDDIERDTRWIPTPGLELMRSALAMPLFHGDRPLGVLTLADSTPYRYSQRALALVAALAAYAVAMMVHHRYAGIIEPPEITQARQLLGMYLAPDVIRDLLAHQAKAMQALQPQVITATLLYACLRGVDRLTDVTVHQLVEHIANPFHTECRAIVYQQQGAYVAIDERSFCAVFGFPQPRFDDAPRALQTAQQVQVAIARLRGRWRQQFGADLAIAGGVTTGQLAVGVLGGDQPVTMAWTGAAMREARRLCQLARNDEIVVTAAVLKTTQADQFTLDPLTPVSLQNGDEPMDIYRLASYS
ncbi:GAF domain-containing protein [uncultured Chloroflexus sp.]|uniref:GAF domain-containing protein n=1 Tax=uncultured Chloroflexus sp. TaxID=214040 RepID=UPI0026236222|nr:GAF domain-containing protein [uncultured Chloroflexus sp.]